MTAQGGLAGWAERSVLRRAGRLTAAGPVPGRLRFVFYGRVSTEDWQDPVTSRTRQREQAAALVCGYGQIVAEFFDVGQTRKLAWACRPQSAALVAQLADPDRGWDAIRVRGPVVLGLMIVGLIILAVCCGWAVGAMDAPGLYGAQPGCVHRAHLGGRSGHDLQIDSC